MKLLWFSAGILTTLACFAVVLPWLRTIPRFSMIPLVSKAVSYAGALILAAMLGLFAWSQIAPKATVSEGPAGSFASAAKLIDGATGGSLTTTNTVGDSANGAERPAMKAGAGSMEGAVANLEARIAKGGASADDWELLAKSYDFLGRSADAVQARAHQLPASGFAASGAPPSAAAAGTAISGEVALAPALNGKAAAGETLFIVAKSVDAPGIPVAVLRTSVGPWPVKFTLDDSLSMMPGRNLSSAGRVTIEARISKKGQAMPAAGDLQGATGVVNPADHLPLKILIDRVIT